MSLSADDRFAILATLARYYDASDRKHVGDALAECTADATITGDFHMSAEDQAEDLEKVFELEVTLKRHLALNALFGEPDASGEVGVRHVLLVIEAGVVPAAVATSVVTDTFRREDGAWRIARHHVEVDPSGRWLVQAAEKVQAGVEKIKDKLS